MANNTEKKSTFIIFVLQKYLIINLFRLKPNKYNDYNKTRWCNIRTGK
jgi:hypothetical protein